LADRGEEQFQLALQCQQAGQLEHAERLYRKALQAHPGWLAALNNLGNVLQSAGRLAEAESCYREALALEPDFAESLFNLGATLLALGREDEAQVCYERGFALSLAVGDERLRDGKPAEAVEFYLRALSLRPDDADLLNRVGVLLDGQGRHEEAVKHLRHALEVRPDDADAAYNLGIVLHGMGDDAGAIEAYDRALRAAPALGEAALGKALSLLTMGDYARGWREYECRYAATFDRPRLARPQFAFPMWRGEPLAGKRLLLVGEQGYGDQIQFIRFAAVLAAQGAVVDVAVDARLRRLFAAAPGVRQVIAGEVPAAGEYEYWSLLLSVPLHLATTVDTVPAPIPYLRAPPEDAEKWAKRLRALPQDRLKIGLVWTAGNTARESKHGRTMPFEALAPLAQLTRAGGVNFIGLQYGERAPAGGPAGFPALELGAEVGDFADNAALLANLDLLVTVDTAVGHLGGALGMPVWTLLPATPDWRWMRKRADSPWYPTAKLLRQDTRGDWAPVVERVARGLEALLAERVAGDRRPA
jgi:Tfp pilus assembly protein PilF/ADP-heptose:LPS heptosyltransferase